MKIIFWLYVVIYSFNVFAYDFELEILTIRDDRDLNIFKYSDTITYRQFKGTTIWKDNLGD